MTAPSPGDAAQAPVRGSRPRTALMVAAANALLVVVLLVIGTLWPVIGPLVGHGNSWWVAPLGAFLGFLAAERIVAGADHDLALRAQYAILGVFCAAVGIWALLDPGVGIPAWRITLTLVLALAATWAARRLLPRAA